MNKCGALLTNLSQTFDYLLQNFLITKLHAYGFDRDSLRMIHSYPVIVIQYKVKKEKIAWSHNR